MPAPDLRRELTLLVLSRYPLVVVEGTDEARIERLLRQVARDLSTPLLEWSATHGLHREDAGVLEGTTDPARALERLANLQGEVIGLFNDLAPFLDRPEIARRVRELTQTFAGGRSTLVLSGVQVTLPAELDHCAAWVRLDPPPEDELQAVVRTTAAELRARRMTVELSEADIAAAARALHGLDADEARRLLLQAGLSDGRLDASDLPQLLLGKRQRLSATGALEWRDTHGGLSTLGGAPQFKRWAALRCEAFSEEARRFGLDAPRGALLTGVPGTGKSLACAAVAGEWKLPLLYLDAGRLYQKYIGDTEATLRRSLATAEALAPSVLWIDEVEKALATGHGGEDGGLSQRILGTVLTWMQERKAPVFILATANDLDALPIETVRRGRFDEVFFFDLPTAEERREIFGLQLVRRGRTPADFDLETLATAAGNFSGAEIEGAIVAALYRAFGARSPLTSDLILEEIRFTRPLAQLRREEVERLRAWGRQHAVPA